MDFETLKSGKFMPNKHIFLGIFGFVLVLLVSFAAFSYAKYRTTTSIKLAEGTINYKVPDLNLVAMYQENDSGEFEVINSAPTSGYLLNTTQSQCTVNGVKDTSIGISYASGKITITDLTKRGTKCYIYFDKIKDTTVPTISNVTSTVTKTSITVTVTASDDTALSTYYYSINNGTYVSETTNSHTFSGLTAGTSYTIKVYVTDTSGNSSVVTTKTISTESDGKTMKTIMASMTKATMPSITGVDTSATTGKVYSVTDDYGTSYVFRGAPTDNWVSFGGYYWRIIRMNGDGSTRMIYAGTSTTTTGTDDQLSSTSAFNSSYNDNAYVGYMYGSTGASTYATTHANTNNSTIKGELDTWYSNLSGVASYIDGNAGFCNDRSMNTGSETWWSSDTKRGYGTNATAYGPYGRLLLNGSWRTTQVPSLKCTNANNDLFTTSGSSRGNGKLTKPIGLITSDEVVYAGGFGGTSSSGYWLYTGQAYWTMSPSGMDTNGYAGVFHVHAYGSLYSTAVDNTHGVRPVINLKADTTFLGSGTSSDPYTVT